MCLIALAWQVSPTNPLLVAANRDEFHARPAQAAQFWGDDPGVLAGRDLRAGGTWLGLSREGRFAAITNIRDPDSTGPAPRSRGELTADFLRGAVPIEAYLTEISERVDSYLGFNLLVSDGRELWYLHGVAGGAPERLKPGVYGLSNAALDVPWPKVRIAKEALEALVASDPDPDHEALAACVADRTLARADDLVGHGLEGEMAVRLSGQFIVTDTYGTRCRSTLRYASTGDLSFREERFDARGDSIGREDFLLSAVDEALQPVQLDRAD